MRMITLMRVHGIRGWRRKHRLPGRPDFVFPKQRVVVFVDGCFWHGCPVHYSEPATATEFWSAKIAGNRRRDRRVSRQLRKKGWKVLRLWEHALIHDHQVRAMAKIKALLQPQTS
jgi:DNA mismatch endonuclease (patch repair protein)